METVVVHHLENSRSLRVLWLLEELSVPYQVRKYRRNRKTALGPPELRKVHRLGKAPVVETSDRLLVESGAILESLAEQYGPHDLLPPSGSREREDCRYWLHYAEGSLMSLLVLRLVFEKMSGRPTPVVFRPLMTAVRKTFDSVYLNEQLRLHAEHIDEWLADRRWFSGERLTIADIQMSFPLQAATDSVPQIRERPNIQDFLTSVRDRPAFHRAVQRAESAG